MRSTITAALGVLAVSALLSAPSLAGAPADVPATTLAAAADQGPLSMVVIGDSISASYTRDGVGDKLAWWSILADRIGAEPTVLAEGGSGFLRRGVRCTGTSFLQRVEAHADVISAADVVIVEGGVNDRRYCLDVRKDGHGDAPSTPAQIESVVSPTLTRIAELAGPEATVIVTTPWGNGKRIASSRWWVTRVIRTSATAHGLEYVDTSTEAIRKPYRTLDGIHPNRHGSEEIAKRLYWRSSLHR